MSVKCFGAFEWSKKIKSCYWHYMGSISFCCFIHANASFSLQILCCKHPKLHAATSVTEMLNLIYQVSAFFFGQRSIKYQLNLLGCE